MTCVTIRRNGRVTLQRITRSIPVDPMRGSTMRPAIRRAFGAGALLLVAACDGGDSGTVGRLTVQLTDASCSDIASAEVWISRVYLTGSDAGAQVVVTDEDQHFDLLDFANGVTTTLGSALVPAADYEQLRFVVDSARIALRDGLTFSDGSSTRLLVVPSGAQTGIKVEFGGPLHIAPGETILVADFDVCRSFVFQGPPDSPTGAHFQPVIHAVVRDIAGSIAGTVSPAAAKAVIYAIVGTDTLASAAADTLTGAYKIWFLAPGTYTVAASATGYQAAMQAGIVVGEAQAVTGVDFTLVP